MSAVEILAVRRGGWIESIAEIRNAMGGAWHIWRNLSAEYAIPHDPHRGFLPLWRGLQRLRIEDRWVLACTFDRVIVPNIDLVGRDDLSALPILIHHLESFNIRYPHATLEGIIATLIRAHADRAVRGICFNHTSVAEDVWWVPGTDDREGRRYNIMTDTGHLYLTSRTVVLINDGVDHPIDTTPDDHLLAG